MLATGQCRRRRSCMSAARKFAAVLPLLLAPGLGAERSERLYVNATLAVGPGSGAVRIATPSGCETPAGEACATPASFVWRFQAALNAFWDLGRGADDKSGGFLVDE